MVITASEYDLKKDLGAVMKRLKKFSKMWVGITGNNRFCFTNSSIMSYLKNGDPSTMSLLAKRTRNAYQSLAGNPQEKSHLGSLWCRWKDNIKHDFKELVRM